jgi:hypothetical protein
MFVGKDRGAVRLAHMMPSGGPERNRQVGSDQPGISRTPAWDAVRDLGGILERCGFSVVSLVFGGIVLFQTQAQDLLRAVADRLSQGNARIVPLVVAAIVWGHTSWYFARVMLYFRFAGGPRNARLRWLAAVVPRLLGAAAIFLFGVACYVAGHPLYGPARFKLHLLGAGMMLAAVAFYLLVHYRRSIIGRLGRGVPTAAAESFEASGLKPNTRWYVGVWLAAALVLLVLFWVAPVRFAPAFGPVALLLLTASVWVPLGSLAVYAGRRFDLPVMTTIVVVAVVFSGTMDNHAVRTLAPPPGAAPPAVGDAFAAWMRPFGTPPPAGAGAPAPRKPTIFFVAAEGGGIRAAYWTAKVLAGLTDDNPAFPTRLFAVSAVSGGSVGAAVFDALLAERHAGRLPAGPNVLENQAKGVLGEDFLSPVLAAMLYPDAVVHFIPFSAALTSADRARALEGSWEASWRAHVGDDRFAQGFAALFASTPGLPHLLLNSTCVETGQRWVVSDLQLAPQTGDVVGDVGDARALIGADVPLSTAAHLSARFPYVSPGGLVSAEPTKCTHLVDGGYFENSGTATLLDLMQALPDASMGGPAYLPVVISINNDPERDCPSTPPNLLSELTIPVDTLLDTRGARGRAAEIGLMKYTTGQMATERLDGCNVSKYGDDQNGWYIEFALQSDCPDGRAKDPGARHARTVPVPLGWMLSGAAQGEMDKQWSSRACRNARAKVAALMSDGP